MTCTNRSWVSNTSRGPQRLAPAYDVKVAVDEIDESEDQNNEVCVDEKDDDELMMTMTNCFRFNCLV